MWSKACVNCISFVLACGLSYDSAPANAFDVLTQHNDSQRTGANLAETVLTPKRVASPDFVQRGFYPVLGQVFAQPLYVSGVKIDFHGKCRGGDKVERVYNVVGVYNVVFVATALNMLYAFNADGTGDGALLWCFDAGRTHAANAAPLYGDGRLPDITPNVGIISTPVIDLAPSTIYFVAMTEDPPLVFRHTLYAVNITNGKERDKIQITGFLMDGSNFDSSHQNQRAALALVADRLFVAWASFGDTPNYDGLVMSYGTVDSFGGLIKHEQFQVAHFNPNAGDRHKKGGIWHSGGGPAIDEQNHIYVVTGDGDSCGDHNGEDFDQSDVKLDSSLRVVDWFTPSFQRALNFNTDGCHHTSAGRSDLDLSVSGPMIPFEWNDRNGNRVRRLLHGSKQGILYNLNRDNLGHFHEAGNDPTQLVRVFDDPNPGPTMDKLHIHTTPALWFAEQERRVYVASDWGFGIRAFRLLDNGQLETTPFLAAVDNQNRYAFNQLSLSANGSRDGIIWTIGCVNCVEDGPPPKTATVGKTGKLLAYDANRLGAPLFTSPELGTFARFNAVTIANGRVYVPTFSNTVEIFGMRDPPLCATEVEARTDYIANIANYTTTLKWQTPPDIDHILINRNRSHPLSSGQVVFPPDGRSTLPPTATTVTIPADYDFYASYEVCTIANDIARSCCAAPIVPERSSCVEVAKCRVKQPNGKVLELLATDTDDPKTWCSDAKGTINCFLECSGTGQQTTDTPIACQTLSAPLCPTKVHANIDLNRLTTTFSWQVSADIGAIEYSFIRRYGDMFPSSGLGLLAFPPNGSNILPPDATTVTVPFDQDSNASYSVCAAARSGQNLNLGSCCAASITPTQTICWDVTKCRRNGREVLPIDTDPPKTWCLDAGGKIDTVRECKTSGGGKRH